MANQPNDFDVLLGPGMNDSTFLDASNLIFPDAPTIDLDILNQQIPQDLAAPETAAVGLASCVINLQHENDLLKQELNLLKARRSNERKTYTEFAQAATAFDASIAKHGLDISKTQEYNGAYHNLRLRAASYQAEWGRTSDQHTFASHQQYESTAFREAPYNTTLSYREIQAREQLLEVASIRTQIKNVLHILKARQHALTHISNKKVLAF